MTRKIHLPMHSISFDCSRGNLPFEGISHIRLYFNFDANVYCYSMLDTCLFDNGYVSSFYPRKTSDRKSTQSSQIYVLWLRRINLHSQCHCVFYVPRTEISFYVKKRGTSALRRGEGRSIWNKQFVGGTFSDQLIARQWPRVNLLSTSHILTSSAEIRGDTAASGSLRYLRIWKRTHFHGGERYIYR